MDIQTEKLNLIQWLANITEPTIIEKFISLKKEQEIDWWDEISHEEKTEIETGIMQADRGETISHKEVIASYEKWLSK